MDHGKAYAALPPTTLAALFVAHLSTASQLAAQTAAGCETFFDTFTCFFLVFIAKIKYLCKQY